MTSLPADQYCVEISRPGPPAVLQGARVPLPAPGPGQVLLRVHAAGVNRPDCLQRAGFYAPPPGASPVPGLEVAGEIVQLGASVPAHWLGAAVCALLTGGGYAEYCVADLALCLPIPDGFSMAEAACLPETCFTVWSNVFDRGQLQPGETLLVQGGASGIGTTAVQMAHALGYRVFATAGTDERCRLVERLGAERCINHRDEDFVAVLQHATAGRGVDVILDMVAGETLTRELQVVADDGRIVLIAFLGGAQVQLDASILLRRRIMVTGSTLRPRSVAFKARIAAALLARVWPTLAAGQWRPLIHAWFPLAEAARAHTLMESGAHIGKIVLEVA